MKTEDVEVELTLRQELSAERGNSNPDPGLGLTAVNKGPTVSREERGSGSVHAIPTVAVTVWGTIPEHTWQIKRGGARASFMCKVGWKEGR